MSPDETALKILEDEITPSQMSFFDFRQRMIDEHPEYLTDNEIHNLFSKHVEGRVDEVPEYEQYNTPAHAHVEDPEVTYERYAVPVAEVPEVQAARVSIHEAVDQVVAWSEAHRPSVEELKRVAARPDPSLSKPKNKPAPKQKKPIGDVTIAEALGAVGRWARGSKKKKRRRRR